MKLKVFPLLLLTVLVGITACKKNKGTEPEPEPPTSRADLEKDTTILYTRDIYLWYTQIPSDFKARSYESPVEIMTAIRAYSKEPGYNRNVDAWSFAIDRATWDNTSSGISGDMGIEVFFNNSTDLRVKMVDEKSPAGLKGVKRGWRITAINGNSSIINTTEAGINFILQNLYYSNAATVTFLKPDGTEETISLNAAQYQSNPIVLDSIYETAGLKVGYLSFQSFLGDTGQIFNEFRRVFDNFSVNNVEEVIIDLRYNGGGYISIQDELANYLVPSSKNNTVMMKQEYNNKYSDFNSTTLFSKTGNLNLSRVFFIVTENTASASELLINNLDPHMDVKIIGRNPSYGKPVGYFPIEVGDWYIFPISFRSTNSTGSGNYFDGFIPDYMAADDVTRNWGDIEEASLAEALKQIGILNPASVELAGRAAIPTAIEVDPAVDRANRKFTKDDFRGMVDTRSMQFEK